MWRALPLLALVALGCGPAKRDVVGSWSGKVVASDLAIDQIYKSAQSAGNAKISKDEIAAYFDTVVPTVMFSDKGTFVMIIGRENFQGTWAMKDATVYLIAATIDDSGQGNPNAFVNGESRLDMTSKSDFVLTLSSDKKRLVGNTKSTAYMRLEFTRI